MTEQYIRRFRPSGLERFGGYLNTLAVTRTTAPPYDLLNSPEFSEACAPPISIEPVHLQTKREAATYLRERLSELRPAAGLLHDAPLWSWLSLLFFDSVCPVKNGQRDPKASAHYIFDPFNHQRRYRHLLAAPYQILLEMPDYNRIYLDAPLDTHGEIIEQTVSKLYMMRIRAVREVIDRLYFDEKSGRAKRGLFPKKESARAGDLRNRLPTRIQQLQKTYDLAALDGGRLLMLLGGEFERWL